MNVEGWGIMPERAQEDRGIPTAGIEATADVALDLAVPGES